MKPKAKALRVWNVKPQIIPLENSKKTESCCQFLCKFILKHIL